MSSTTTASTAQKSILVVLTSCDTLLNGWGPTGWYLPELVHPYFVFKDSFKLTFASPKGGEAPLDEKSIPPYKDDAEATEFLSSSSMSKSYKETVRLDSVKAEDYDAIFYVGGSGPVIDLSEDATSIKLIEEFYKAGKIVAAVCHAPAVFARVKVDGEPLIKGKNFTGFSNTEELAAKAPGCLPFLLEDELQSLGGIYARVEDWGVKVVVDGNLYTGQNPASAGPLAKTVKAALLA